jgi:hypothetical protein
LGLRDPAAEHHEDDHVVHLASAESAGAGSKRVSAPLGAVALPVLADVAPRSVAAPSRPLILASRRSAELLRTVVLRI